jgi:hypothetical protein
MLGGAFAAAADGRALSELAEARIGTRRPRRRVARLELLLVVRPHGRMPLPPPPPACSCRFRSGLATWPDAGVRRRHSPLPADDTRRCITARRFGLPPVSARWKRQLLETRGCSPQVMARAAPTRARIDRKNSSDFRRASCFETKRLAGFRRLVPKIPQSKTGAEKRAGIRRAPRSDCSRWHTRLDVRRAEGIVVEQRRCPSVPCTRGAQEARN